MVSEVKDFLTQNLTCLSGPNAETIMKDFIEISLHQLNEMKPRLLSRRDLADKRCKPYKIQWAGSSFRRKSSAFWKASNGKITALPEYQLIHQANNEAIREFEAVFYQEHTTVETKRY